MKKWILIIPTILIIVVGIVLLFSEDRNHENERVNEDNIAELNMENTLTLMSIYHKLGLIKILDTASAVNSSKKKVKIREIIGSDEKLVLWFSTVSCNTCYKRELEYLKALNTDPQYQSKILFFASGFNNNRSFQYYIDEQNIENMVYSVQEDFLSKNPIVDSSIPFIFSIDSSLQLKNIIMLDKSLPSQLSKRSIEYILASYTSNTRTAKVIEQ